MEFPRALLEEWMRKYYFDTDVDIGSSGVEDYSLAEIRELLGITREELDEVVFHDSQTLGGSGLRQALADRWTGGDAERTMVTHGSTEANFLIMTALLEAGDEVVVLDPFYQQLYTIAEVEGCRLRRWPLPWERGFRPDVEVLEELVGPRTKMVVVNFPHNPTGATLTREEQERLIRTVADVGAYLVWDGAFAELTYDAPPLPDPVLQYDRALSMGTLSKAYGLPGLRVGWCLGSPEVLEKFARLRDYTILHLSPLVELLARHVIEKAEVLVSRRLETARRNRERVEAWIEEHREDVEWVPPAGGVCGFVRFRGDRDVEELCHRLAREHRVLLVPGSCFHAPEHARLGFGGSPEELEQGLGALSRALRAGKG